MHFYLIGINHNSAPISQREEIFRQRSQLSELLVNNLDGRGIVLATCNRFEVYGIANDVNSSKRDMDFIKNSISKFVDNIYIEVGYKQVYEHALRLASGLESQLRGEKQIVNQLKIWLEQDKFPVVLKELWLEVLVLADKLRLYSGLDKINDNLASLIFKELSVLLKTEKKIEMVIFGTGKVAELFASENISRVNLTFVSHKNILKAQSLADMSGSKVIDFKNTKGIFPEADVLISASSSPHFILNKRDFSNLDLKSDKPLYIYDLAMPRDIDPEVGSLKNIVLKNLDDLKYIFDYPQKYNQNYFNCAEYLIKDVLTYEEKIKNG